MDDENRFLKFWIIAAVLAVLALAVVPGRSAYRHLKEKHSVAQARAFLARGDYNSAWLSARQALMLNSNNIEACRVMAELDDAVHSPAALDWCQRLVNLSPAITNKLLLASVGLRYQGPPYPLTSQVLADLSASAANVPAFHIISAELDLSLHRMAEAETQFEVACQLEPTNRLFQLNLAVIRLGSTNGIVADGARATLKEFSSDTDLGPPALRSLMADRLLHNDAAGAMVFSTQLLASAQATLIDRLQHLGILKHLQSPALTTGLSALQRDAATNATMATQITTWMEANGFLPEAVVWLKTLPANIQAQTPVRLALVDCYLNSTNWLALRKLTAGTDWGEADFLRLAFSSHAWSELGEPLMADGDWRSAVSEANEKLGELNSLSELAGRWNMSREQEELLWRILQRFPNATWAELELEHCYPSDLQRRYFASGNTKGLYQLYSENVSLQPENMELKNDSAATALLLKTNLKQAFKWAAEDYAQKPNDPTVASTYAYALYLQGRSKDGLAAFQKLDAAAFKQPSIALYYGVLLRAVGQETEAATYLHIALTEGQLLPEEKQLIAETDKTNQTK